jgi:hypothetical protein
MAGISFYLLLLVYFQYKENVPKWNTACELSAASTDISTLEATIHQHQTLYETMCQSYTEVHSTSKKLLYQLDHLVQICKKPQEERRHVSSFLLLLYTTMHHLIISVAYRF